MTLNAVPKVPRFRSYLNPPLDIYIYMFIREERTSVVCCSQENYSNLLSHFCFGLASIIASIFEIRTRKKDYQHLNSSLIVTIEFFIRS